MEQYSKEFLAAMYNTYCGNKVKYYMGFNEYADDIGIMNYCGINNEGIVHGAINAPKYSNQVMTFAFTEDTLHQRPILALKPLDSISDEDALEIKKTIPENYIAHIADLSKFKEVIVKVHKNGDLPVQAADKCRELGIDVGFRDVPSLIAANLAIDINQIKK